ncbi:3810_t:CDS:2 [Cetraspora pellucida]|uniref:3810_t:CDS:1 n=1 Tax=Cetraspora pellucida TaxID=1433469 RepID=A0A9N9IUR8_9GLOM|nr:3810_t:CDS:2 [Cetraspora pellucida]
MALVVTNNFGYQNNLAEPATILINNKIYFYSGDNAFAFLSDFFYLDVSIQFTINDIGSMPRVNLTPTTGLPSRTGSTACTYGEDKNRIVYIGGRFIVGDNFTTVYDITTQQWSTPKVSENFTVNRWLLQCVVSGNDIYVYGGNIGQTNMTRLDTLSLTWTEFSSGILAPVGVQDYTAILLNNESILYIGGQQGGDVTTLSYPLLDQEIFLNQDMIMGQSLYATQFNQVLILYGYPNSNSPIVALDINQFKWSTPTISNGGPNFTLRRFTSILIGTYIFIAFGASDINGINSTNNVFLLDVSKKDNYVWVTLYDPTKKFTLTSTLMPSMTFNASSSGTQSNTPSNAGTIIGIAFGAIAGLIILMTAAVLIVKRYGHPLYYSDPQRSSDKPNNKVIGSQSLYYSDPSDKPNNEVIG